MPDPLETQLLRIYCTQDGRVHPFTRADRILCEDGHELARDFPHIGYWDYCCDCNIFIPHDALKGNEAPANCLLCDREIARRFLCGNCNMMTVESDAGQPSKLLSLAVTGIPSSCPGCLNPSPPNVREHECYSLFESYTTARKVCPFCNDTIDQTTKEHEGRRDEAPKVASGNVTFNFPILESFSRSHDRFRFQSYLPRTRRGWFEFIAICGLALTVIGVLLALFPSVPAAVSWHVEKTLNHPPIVAPIECDVYVPHGQQLKLKANARDADGHQLDFKWSCTSGRIDGNGAEVELGTDGIVMRTVPVEVTVQLRVSDKFGESSPIEVRVTVLPRNMANNPPVLRTPPRCNCSNPEVVAGESLSFYALAEDQDKDDLLTYYWESSSPAAQIRNSNSTSGSTIILDTAGLNPRFGAVPVKITLRVGDGNGGDVGGDVTVMVLPKRLAGIKESLPPAPAPLPPNHAPKLEAFTADKPSVETGEQVRLWALVTDPDGDFPLYYDWKASAGEIQNKGETATLDTSEVDPSQVIVTVTISDGRGGRTSQKMFLVVRPSPAKAPSKDSPETASQANIVTLGMLIRAVVGPLLRQIPSAKVLGSLHYRG